MLTCTKHCGGFCRISLAPFQTRGNPSGWATLAAGEGATLATAVTEGALVGPAQVASRLLEFGFLRHVHPLLSARLYVCHVMGQLTWHRGSSAKGEVSTVHILLPRLRPVAICPFVDHRKP